MFSPRQIGGVLVALVTTNAIAAEDAPPTNNASIYAGGEWGDTESQRLDAGAVFRYHTATIFSAAVSRGEADLTVGRASSTYATARVTHDFGSFGLGAGVRHGEVENVSSTLGWFASGFYDYREMRIVAEIESRDSELARQRLVNAQASALPAARFVGLHFPFLERPDRNGAAVAEGMFDQPQRSKVRLALAGSYQRGEAGIDRTIFRFFADRQFNAVRHQPIAAV